MINYDIAIIGAGPAGLFAAWSLAIRKLGLRILIVDKGFPPGNRICPGFKGACHHCESCNVLSGGGGAGLFSDGKLVLDLGSGGHLDSFDLDKYKREELLREVESTLIRFDGESVLSEPKEINIKYWQTILRKSSLKLKTYPVRHLGTENLTKIMRTFVGELKKLNVTFLFNSSVNNIKVDKGFALKILHQGKATKVKSKNLIIAVGKDGSSWIVNQLRDYGIEPITNRRYLGVRIETKEAYLRDLMSLSFDPKIYFEYPDGTKVKTHCFCRNGTIIGAKYRDGLTLVGGHTVFTEKNKVQVGSEFTNSNFAVLVGDTPYNSVTDGQLKSFIVDANKLASGKLLVQRLGDLGEGVKTTWDKLQNNSVKPSNFNLVCPGNLLDVKNPLELNLKIIDFLQRFNVAAPGVNNDDTLIYAPAVEWWMDRIPVGEGMETSIKGLYTVGDGAGLSQGIVHAGATGIIAAQHIVSSLFYHKHEVI